MSAAPTKPMPAEPNEPTRCDVRVVLCTAPSQEVAATLGRGAVERRLAACANIIPGVRSIYIWDGAVCDEEEVQLLLKTSDVRAAELTAWLAEAHPYDVPELITLSPEAASEAYGAWVLEQTATQRSSR